MDEYTEIKLDIFEHLGQRARLRSTLTARELIEEILREFDDITSESPDQYALFLKGTDRPLQAGLTLAQLDIQPQDQLVLEYARQSLRRMISPENHVSLHDEVNGRSYEILWQPAIIGRPTNEAEHNIMLAVNLQLHPKGLTVSRKHAEITFSGGHYFIEPMAENNPVTLNDKTLAFHTKRELKHGDKINIGRSSLPLVFNLTPVIAPQPHRHTTSTAMEKPAQVSSPKPAATIPMSKPTPASLIRKPDNNGEMTQLEGDGKRAARLVIERSSDANQAELGLELTSFPMIIGRDLPLLKEEKDVSRQHMEITYDPGSRKYYVTDRKSTNGVFLEGTRIEPNLSYEIQTGARIGLGATLILRFEGG